MVRRWHKKERKLEEVSTLCKYNGRIYKCTATAQLSQESLEKICENFRSGIAHKCCWMSPDDEYIDCKNPQAQDIARAKYMKMKRDEARLEEEQLEEEDIVAALEEEKLADEVSGDTCAGI